LGGSEPVHPARGGGSALCEPALLKDPARAGEVLLIHDGITRSLASATDRRHEGFKVLRQALGYCWSVAAAAAPARGRPLIETWLRSEDPDVAWVTKTNLGKARMSALGKDWLARQNPPREVTKHKSARRTLV
jgi:hypothetical protein